VYVQDVAGTPARVLVPFDRRQQYPWSFTPDGASLLYSNRDEAAHHDLWTTDLQGKARKRWLATEFSESEAALSPDGRLVAFTSDMTGAREVYLQSFADGHDRVRVSTGGGYAPRWRGDGRELFYVTVEGQLMAAPVASGGRPPDGLLPRPLFRFDGHALQDYDVAPDGGRFLLNLGTGDWAGASVEQDLDAGISADVIVGWTRLLKR
jgi:dipeptidyl aminopeptidase/acylaminoacyl peptidase